MFMRSLLKSQFVVLTLTNSIFTLFNTSEKAKKLKYNFAQHCIVESAEKFQKWGREKKSEK